MGYASALLLPIFPFDRIIEVCIVLALVEFCEVLVRKVCAVEEHLSSTDACRGRLGTKSTPWQRSGLLGFTERFLTGFRI